MKPEFRDAEYNPRVGRYEAFEYAAVEFHDYPGVRKRLKAALMVCERIGP